MYIGDCYEYVDKYNDYTFDYYVDHILGTKNGYPNTLYYDITSDNKELIVWINMLLIMEYEEVYNKVDKWLKMYYNDNIKKEK